MTASEAMSTEAMSTSGVEVACPECGTRAVVALSRRESTDFCTRCDFPLFWTPQTIQLGEQATAQESLRRLPGTAGKVTVASAPCPHCGEANSLIADTCVRCAQPMVLAPPPPPPAPEPVVIAPPPPPEPEPQSWLWLWLLLGTTTLVLLTLLVWWLFAR